MTRLQTAAQLELGSVFLLESYRYDSFPVRSPPRVPRGRPQHFAQRLLQKCPLPSEGQSEFSFPHEILLPCSWENSPRRLVFISFSSSYVLMAYFPFVFHDPELNATIILKGNIILSSEKNKGPKKVCTILMHEYFYP